VENFVETVERNHHMRGEATSKLDMKGRLNFPANIRKGKGFGDSFVLAKALRVPCIQVYTVESWEAYTASLAESNPKSKVEQALRFMSAADAEADKQGRFFMPTHLRKYAMLDTDVVFKSYDIDGKVEIWSAEELEKSVEAIDGNTLADELNT
jgi:MraZ protein